MKFISTTGQIIGLVGAVSRLIGLILSFNIVWQFGRPVGIIGISIIALGILVWIIPWFRIRKIITFPFLIEALFALAFEAFYLVEYFEAIVFAEYFTILGSVLVVVGWFLDWRRLTIIGK